MNLEEKSQFLFRRDCTTLFLEPTRRSRVHHSRPSPTRIPAALASLLADLTAWPPTRRFTRFWRQRSSSDWGAAGDHEGANLRGNCARVWTVGTTRSKPQRRNGTKTTTEAAAAKDGGSGECIWDQNQPPGHMGGWFLSVINRVY